MFEGSRKRRFLRLIPLLVAGIAAAGFLAGCAAPVISDLNGTNQQLPSPTAVPSPASRITPTSIPSPTVTPILPPSSTATIEPTDLPPGPVTIESLPITSRFLGNARTLSIYLPPNYVDQPQLRYKVLYANDGQDLAAMDLEGILNRYYALRQLEPVIVVGIPAGDDRDAEYGTGPTENVDGSGGQAQEYVDFLLQEVMPLINARYRTQPGAQNTALIGWSLGGLTAFYVGWQYPDQVGIVGAFSGSFWWRTNINSLQDMLDSRVIHKMVRGSPSRPALRMWFSAGTGEFPWQDRDDNGIVDMVQDTTDLVAELAQKGYQEGTDYLYEQIEGGTHDQATWAGALPDFLRWAFPPGP